MSEQFWDAYEEIKNLKESRSVPSSEKSLEQQALNNLKTFLNRIQDERKDELEDFVKTLRDDIIDYGTLPDYTLRRIANLEFSNEKKIEDSIKEIELLKEELGEDYLEKEKSKRKKIVERSYCCNRK